MSEDTGDLAPVSSIFFPSSSPQAVNTMEMLASLQTLTPKPHLTGHITPGTSDHTGHPRRTLLEPRLLSLKEWHGHPAGCSGPKLGAILGSSPSLSPTGKPLASLIHPGNWFIWILSLASLFTTSALL